MNVLVSKIYGSTSQHSAKRDDQSIMGPDEMKLALNQKKDSMIDRLQLYDLYLLRTDSTTSYKIRYVTPPKFVIITLSTNCHVQAIGHCSFVAQPPPTPSPLRAKHLDNQTWAQTCETRLRTANSCRCP